MKFQNVAGFEKHIQASQAIELVPTYLLTCASKDERKKIIGNLVSQLRKKHPEADLFHYEMDGHVLSSVLDQLRTKPFFSSHVIIVLDQAEECNKKQRELLENYVLHPSSFATFILGSSSFKDFSEIYNKAKKDVVVLDLTEEKPWDKQRRLQEWIVARAAKEGKKLTSASISQLFELCGTDVLLLEQELLKLSCFVGARDLITPEDILQVGSSYVLPTGWQLAEKLVWEGKVENKGQVLDLAAFLPLLGQIRYHLQLGKQIAGHLENQKSREEISKLMPQVRPNQLEKYLKMLSNSTSHFFDEALKLLFHIEILSKNSSLGADFIWDLLVAKMSYLKTTHDKQNTAPCSTP